MAASLAPDRPSVPGPSTWLPDGAYWAPITVPVITRHGADDAFVRSTVEISAADRTVLAQLVEKRIVEGAGHVVPPEPAPVAQAIIDVLGRAR